MVSIFFIVAFSFVAARYFSIRAVGFQEEFQANDLNWRSSQSRPPIEIISLEWIHFKGSNSAVFISPPSLWGQVTVNSEKKEFAPMGENSFI